MAADQPATAASNAALPPCPECGSALRVEFRLKAKPVSSFSLAGVQTKFSATEVPWVICDSCGLESEGKSA